MDFLTSVLFPVIVLLAIMFYRIYKMKPQMTNSDLVSLYVVEAGPTKRFFRQRQDFTTPIEVDCGGVVMNDKLRYFVVKNNCMRLKGIKDGDIIGVKMFDHNFSMPDDYKGKISLIYLHDKNFRGYKIRELGDYKSDINSYETYHYKGGKLNKSSRPHSTEAIKGLIVEVHHKDYLYN